MNIFSKWFGSKDIEEHEDKVEETVCVKEPEQDCSPDPQNLPEAFRYVVRKWGADYLRNRSLINFRCLKIYLQQSMFSSICNLTAILRR